MVCANQTEHSKNETRAAVRAFKIRHQNQTRL